MRLLLGSGGFSTAQRLHEWQTALSSHLEGRPALFIPYALDDHDKYLAAMRERLPGFKLESVHKAKDPVAAVKAADAILVGGGNTFRLLDQLQRRKLLPAIKARVAAGIPYAGASAGANIACPTIVTTNDMPIVQPQSFEAMGLIPFQINPHYFSGPAHYEQGGKLMAYGGETRDDRIREYHEENNRPVLGLWEGAVLRVKDGKAKLLIGQARLFKKSRPSQDLKEGADLSALLK